MSGEDDKKTTQYTYLETFRSLLLLGGGGIHKTIRMCPDPLQGLDHTIEGAKESGVPQRLLLVSCLYFLSRSSLWNTKDRIIIREVGHEFCEGGMREGG